MITIEHLRQLDNSLYNEYLDLLEDAIENKEDLLVLTYYESLIMSTSTSTLVLHRANDVRRRAREYICNKICSNISINGARFTTDFNFEVLSNDQSDCSIRGFCEYFGFLSNYHLTNIEYNGLKFFNAEAAFQAQKDPSRAHEFCNLNPGKAEFAGRRVQIREDWEEVKEQIMYDVCFAKFTQNKELMLKLLETGNAILIKDNTWGDKEWGTVNGEGNNKLGIILMKIRNELLNLHFERYYLN